MNGPERGRGIDNPFANRVGPQLAAYYALKTTERDLDLVVSHEKKVDLINTDQLVGLQEFLRGRKSGEKTKSR